MTKGPLTETNNAGSTVASKLNYYPTEQEIAARAYDIFLARGSGDGHDLDDWLQAERELTKPTGKTPLQRAAAR